MQAPTKQIKKRQPSKLRKTLAQYIVDARGFHGDKYDYSKAVYETAESVLTIICPDHGEFEQKARVHLRRGCKKCGGEKRRLTTELFKEKSRKIHGDRYNYDFVDYVTKRVKVKIVCKYHGEFMQSPSDHLYGSGCRDCANSLTSWSRTDYIEMCKKHSNKTNIYLLKMSSGCEVFYKVGLTAYSIKQRYAKNNFYKIETISVLSMDSGDAWDAEKQILRDVSRFKHVPFFRIQGYTECFSFVPNSVAEFFGVHNV